MASTYGAVRRPFRLIAGFLGGLMIFFGVLVVASSARSIATVGWGSWWRNDRKVVACSLIVLGFGIAFLRAARTGRDPFVDDDDADTTEPHPPSA
jgi:hypothetical protein